MTLIINNKSKEISTLLKEKLKDKNIKGNLLKHFGKLKRNIDGLNYQTSIRKDED